MHTELIFVCLFRKTYLISLGYEFASFSGEWNASHLGESRGTDDPPLG